MSPERTRIQDYDADKKTFDIIILHNSINHLDEETCINLLNNKWARDRYKSIFININKLASENAKLIITDCDRKNFFALFRFRNPFAKEIE